MLYQLFWGNMALIQNFLLLCFLLSFLVPNTAITKLNSPSPKALVIPITKDDATLQYTVEIRQRTPPVSAHLLLHLNGEGLWVYMGSEYTSSTFRKAHCGAPQCSVVSTYGCSYHCDGPVRGCFNYTCFNFPYNPILPFTTGFGLVGQDVVSVQTTDGYNPGHFVSVPKFVFTVTTSATSLRGFPQNADGLAGFSKSKASLPRQFSEAFNIPQKFALCLPSSPAKNGVLFIGDGPYVMLPGIDLSKTLTYTPLIHNPGGIVAELYFNLGSTYYIGVTSIRVNNKPVDFDLSLLKILGNEGGSQGTIIVSVFPYTTLISPIYEAVTSAFVEELSHIHRVPPVDPFTICYDSASLGRTRAGPAVPPIDLVLQSNDVFWRFYGSNSMVQVNKDVVCLGFIDAGADAFTSIVIGTHQQQDNLLHFDIEGSRFGFSSSLSIHETTCSDFNFTSNGLYDLDVM